MGSHEIKEMRNTILERSKSGHRMKIKNTIAVQQEWSAIYLDSSQKTEESTTHFSKIRRKKKKNLIYCPMYLMFFKSRLCYYIW